MVPVTAMSGRPCSDTFTAMPSFAPDDILAGDGEDRLARVVAGNLDDHLAGDHDLTGVRPGRGDDAVVGRIELGVAELVLGDAEIGFGRLDLPLARSAATSARHRTGNVWRNPWRAGRGSVAPGPLPGRARPWPH